MQNAPMSLPEYPDNNVTMPVKKAGGYNSSLTACGKT